LLASDSADDDGRAAGDEDRADRQSDIAHPGRADRPDGWSPVPVPPASPPQDRDAVVERAGAALVVCHRDVISARQIVIDHSGQVAVASGPGAGTVVTVTLPAAEMR
jgi:hypothetical protein